METEVVCRSARAAIAARAERDRMLLPLLSFLTVCVMLVPTEWFAREIFSRTKTNALDCLVVDDPKTGVRGIPNCVCSQKVYEESSSTEYRMNSRGYRAGMELVSKPLGTFRIVLIGSSIAEGMRVAREQSLAALLPEELSREIGRKVELYNEGMMYGTPHRVDLAFKDVLDAQPDMILWMVTPWDMEHASVADAPWAKPQVGVSKGIARSSNPEIKVVSRQATAGRRTITGTLGDYWKQNMDTLARARTIIMLKHILYKSQTQYVKSYLMQDDEGGEFMKATLSPASKDRLSRFDGYAADIETKAAHAKVLLVVTVIPTGAQATMISMGEWPAGINPFKLGDQVRSIVESHGGTYIDILRSFRSILHPEQYFLPVDGHPTFEGHRILTGLLAKDLTGGAVPALRVGINSRASKDSE